jgi:hypothetical protein
MLLIKKESLAVRAVRVVKVKLDVTVVCPLPIEAKNKVVISRIYFIQWK